MSNIVKEKASEELKKRLWDIICNGGDSQYVVERSRMDIDLNDNKTYILLDLGEIRLVVIFYMNREEFLQLGDVQIKDIIDAQDVGLLPFEVFLMDIYERYE